MIFSCLITHPYGCGLYQSIKPVTTHPTTPANLTRSVRTVKPRLQGQDFLTGLEAEEF